MKITILCAGAWGTALAINLAKRHDVILWGRNLKTIYETQLKRENITYLRGFKLPSTLILTTDFQYALSHINSATSKNNLLILAVSVSGLRVLVETLSTQVIPHIIWLCKGLEKNTCLLPHEIVQEVLGKKLAIAVLSGPSFAQEIARNLPCALTVASTNKSLCNHIVSALHAENMRIYSSEDLIGVEIGGAIKNILAIAAGVIDGLQLGFNARAALITRGLAELVRFGVKLGGRLETFMGLSGIGDLILTCTSNLSRNYQVGLSLAKGEKLSTIISELGHIAEGVYCVQAVCSLAQKHKIDMPITYATSSVLFHGTSIKQMITELLSRDPQDEMKLK